VAGNEPIFARVIFESLSIRYAAALASLEKMLGRKLTAIHMLGGANRNKLLVRLTEEEPDCLWRLGRRKVRRLEAWRCSWHRASRAESRSGPRRCGRGRGSFACGRLRGGVRMMEGIPRGLKPHRFMGQIDVRLKPVPFN